MIELLMGGAKVVKPAGGFRLVSLAPSRNNGSGGSGNGYTGIPSVEFYNQNGEYFVPTGMTATASTQLDASFSASQALTSSAIANYWANGGGNDGNTGRTCWWQVTMTSFSAKRVRVFHRTNQSMFKFDVELVAVDGTRTFLRTCTGNASGQVWPLAASVRKPLLTNDPYTDIEF